MEKYTRSYDYGSANAFNPSKSWFGCERGGDNGLVAYLAPLSPRPWSQTMVALCAPLGLTTCVRPYSNGRFAPAHIHHYISQSRRIGTNQANDIPAATELAPPKLIPRTVPAAAAAPPLLASTLADATNPMAWTAKGLKRRGARGYEGAEAIGGEEKGKIWAAERGAAFSYGSECGGRESIYGEIAAGGWQGAVQVLHHHCAT